MNELTVVKLRKEKHLEKQGLDDNRFHASLSKYCSSTPVLLLKDTWVPRRNTQDLFHYTKS